MAESVWAADVIALGTGLTTAVVVPACRLLSGNTLAVGMLRTTLVVCVTVDDASAAESFFFKDMIFFSVTTIGVSC